MKKNDKGEAGSGFLAVLVASVSWGLFPVYWKQLGDIPAEEILCHRILWSVVFLVLLLSFRRLWGDVSRIVRRPNTLGLLFLSGLTIGGNWLLYIWAVNSGRVLEASLGYYVNPLINMLFGCIFFKDRLRRGQWMAICLMVLGVSYQVLLYGQIPLVSFGLALSFSLYALIRKSVEVDAVVGLFIETMILVLPALLFILFLEIHGRGALTSGSFSQTLLLMGTGLVTSVPMMCFVYGARRLSLVTVGLMQYLAPTLSFLLGLFVYHESLGRPQMVTFASIWIALILYTTEGIFRGGNRTL